MKCPRCQQDNSVQDKFCGECGTPLGPFGTAAGSPRSYAEVMSALAEALEQQAATDHILRVISSSPGDMQPVFDAVLEKAVDVCGADLGLLFRYESKAYRAAAFHGARPEFVDFFSRGPIVPDPDTGLGRIIATQAAVQIEDVTAEALYTQGDPLRRATADLEGIRTWLGVPMIKDGTLLGAIVIYRREVRRFGDAQVRALKTFADQAVIAVDNVRLFTELQQKNRALTQAHAHVSEALERQTATSEILRVISRSPTDTQPVFDTIAASAARLCAARDAQVLRVDGDVLRLVAAYGSPSMPPVRPISRGHGVGRAVIDRRPIHVRDMAEAIREFPETSAPQHGVQSIIAIPLLRNDVAVGVIRVSRTQIEPFTEAQIALLQTFADQAVIAIENVRLFNETKEALDQQTATAEILRAISSSPTEVQPVFDAITRSAVRLCDGHHASLFRFDGALQHFVAHHGVEPATLGALQRRYPRPPDVSTVTGRAIVAGRVIHVPDLRVDHGFTESQAITAAAGYRAVLAVPMFRESRPLGVIFVVRKEPRPFTDEHIALVQTFADQAVIAIENVRLFNELEAKNANLSEALEQQTATGEILRVISSSPADILPVLDAVATSAARLCDALDATILLRDGDAVVPRTHSGPLGAPFGERQRITRDWVTGRAILEGRTIHVPDLLVSDEFPQGRELARRYGHRATLVVPLLREGVALGAILVRRREAAPFSDKQIALLQTFADQAAIAIENVRLFNELAARNREIEEKSRQLEIVSQHKSEFLANMSHELRTPLNAIIGFSEVLGERMFGELNEKQEEYLSDIHASGQHLLSLINDILDLSKIEAGRMELEPTDFHLPAAVDNALTLVRERAERHGIALYAAIDDRIECIRADERKIKQVMLNLLSNAIKFTPEGGRIDVRARLGDGIVEVSVSDTGVGIAPEDQEAIFEEFRQVGTAAKKVEGTGLGLALSRKFVELHGGRIWVESRVGIGSTFTFTIPVTPTD